MIDVSLFRAADPCPRCPGRRVWRVSIDTDEWSCVPNAVPTPWLREQITDHDATEQTMLVPLDNPGPR